VQGFRQRALVTHDIRQIHNGTGMAGIEYGGQSTSSRKGFDEHIVTQDQPNILNIRSQQPTHTTHQYYFNHYSGTYYHHQ
jgi:hypothetical protein